MNAPDIRPFSADELAAARVAGGRMLDALATLEAEAPLRLARLARTFGLPVLGHAALMARAPDFGVMPFEQALRRECIALREDDGGLCLVLADPFDRALMDGLGARLAEPVRWALGDRDDIAACLARHEDEVRRAAGLSDTRGGERKGDGAEDLSLRRISEDASPVVKLVNSTLYDALKQGASDIHLECVPAGLVIQYRIDGVLSRVGSVQGAELAEQAISRVKVMAELDIAERRVPQDGRFKALAAGREIDFRVSIMPSIHGEDAVLRVLDKEHLSAEMTGLSLETLGFDDTARATLRRLASEPYGMLLVTGPTGSGKTTSLYATLAETNHGLDKIITIEDPVEYQLPGVLQIPVNEKKGLTFARGLRSILRHDPDKIMVGEIRDGETAEIAVQAALTGHLVFTTVHANNVFDVIGRFTHMGIDPYNLTAALNGVVAQRLIRIICPHCADDIVPDAQLVADSALASTAGFRFRAGHGCGQCRGSGYKGRRAIAEVLILDDEIRELIVTRAPVRALKAKAAERGFRSLRDAATALVAAGETTLQELNRVTLLG
ncbi:type II/IV secretion system protein [Nitrogeniibacter mangrovi]|uniref:Type II/IV secretion system protein n=1 Tax=Nitrogeniibacter mangrovi TaxID=2016596 RepID=A0A6C1AXY6_9RHOO|nr:GspE/PulE family protein [Nitrogeniibacter mangrovi]QID16197.1 type II/IV secretion system protein [Nitrogeniibacter mangrovi]